MSQQDVVLLSGVRTAIGDYGSSLKGIPPTELAAMVVREAVSRAGVEGADVGACVFGNVLHTEPSTRCENVPCAVEGGRHHLVERATHSEWARSMEHSVAAGQRVVKASTSGEQIDIRHQRQAAAGARKCAEEGGGALVAHCCPHMVPSLEELLDAPRAKEARTSRDAYRTH